MPGRFWPGVAIAMLVVFFVVDSISLYARDAYRNDLEVTSIDVGQGSSTLVRFPGSRKMLIDGGGFPIVVLMWGNTSLPPSSGMRG